MSNIENSDYTFLSECYYKQELGKFSIIAGLNNYNEFFNVVDYGLLFLNSSFGINPAVSLNMPVAIFPRNGLGALLGYQINDRLNFKTAIYDGNPGDFDTDPYNTNWNWNTDEGIISAAEIQYASAENDELFFAYKAGFTYYNIDYVSFDNSNQNYSSNWTAYIIAEQQLYQNKINPKKKLGFFIQSGFAPQPQNMVDFYLGSGLVYYSVFTKKKNNQLGVAFAHCSMSKHLYQRNPFLLRHETATELTYQYQFNDNFYLQPGFHYVINPGADKRIEHASALSLRGMLKF